MSTDSGSKPAVSNRRLGWPWRLLGALLFFFSADSFTVGDEAWVSDVAPSTIASYDADSPYSESDPLAALRGTPLIADQAQFQQPLTSRVETPMSAALSPTSQRAAQQFWTSFGGAASMVQGGAVSPTSYAAGAEGTVRAATDLGDLLGNSPTSVNLGVQRRNPIVNDPRVRGSRVGSLAASGSYWIPARIDLDTAVSKIDSRIVRNAAVIAGPYSALYGPGFHFVDFELEPAPRFGQRFETHGSTLVDYRTNGEQWYGRQRAWGGNDVWGFRASYGHRTGSDYDSGDGVQIPSSYKSRDIDLALGGQLTESSSFDGHALRLDQTDLELAGQAFDIDWLVTDGYEVTYESTAPLWADALVFDSWYNRTRFEGSTDRPSKRRQFPFYDLINFHATTDVDSLSTGYSLSSTWLGLNEERFVAGADLRYLKQELNEISSGDADFSWRDQNSPIPRSYWSNPGLFVQYDSADALESRVAAGARIDYVGTNILDDPARLAAVGVDSELSPLSASDYLGSDDFQQNELLGLGFLSLDVDVADDWIVGGKIGYGERAPNLTERYAIEPFMFLIQNGLNTVTGDPELDKERVIQTDLKLARTTGRLRSEIVGFHAWARDYITFEATSVVEDQGEIEQVNLKYVNTDLATLWGCEGRLEYDWNDLLTPFATIKYVQGTDRSRDGSFATRAADPGLPSEQIADRSRGFFSGLDADSKEALPGILPLECRLGLRWEERVAAVRWGVETYARIVDAQNRVARSLIESPTPGFTVWDVRTFLRPNDSVLMVAGVENFTDKQYREHLDFRSATGLSTYRPGVNFYLGTELTY